MSHIKSIEIKYFRSIYKTYISDISDLSIISGVNDVGKSNILKALNLFFNGETDWKTPFNFKDDYNHGQYENARSKSKARQYIEIRITFLRGDRCPSLPDEFNVTKQWYRAGEVVQTNDVDQQLLKKKGKSLKRANGLITQFLNSYRYIYIPAIKDARVFDNILLLLRDTVYSETLEKDNSIKQSLEDIDNKINKATEKLNEEFQNATKGQNDNGINSKITTPQDFADLITRLNVKTQSGTGKSDVSLNFRGDGIRVRYLPSILYFISESSKFSYIWGFEEPENSLEYKRAMDLSKDFYDKYSRVAQVFITTHSPAFLSLIDKPTNVSIYRCQRETENLLPADSSREKHPEAIIFEKTTIKKIESSMLNEMAEDLGYYLLQKEMHDDYLAKSAELERRKEEIESIKRQGTKILYVEDECTNIYKIAWLKLHNIDFNEQNVEERFITNSGFEILSGKGAGGVYGLLNCPTADFYKGKRIIGLFDYDGEGSQHFYKLTTNGFDNKRKDIQGNLSVGFYRQKDIKSNDPVIVALLLPCPERLDGLITGKGNWETDAKFANYLEIETLLPDTVLKEIGCTKDEFPIPYYKAGKNKQSFWKHCVSLSYDDFTDFIPLYARVEEFLDLPQSKDSPSPAFSSDL